MLAQAVDTDFLRQIRAPEGRESANPFSGSGRAPLAINPILDAVLPDGGLPRGAVVELSSVHGLGHATSVALGACAAAQAEARLRSGDPKTVGAWCAFLDPWATLHAPAVARSGVDLKRLLVVRPPLETLVTTLPRIAVRIAQSRAFSLIAIDLAGVPGAGHAGASVPLDRWVNVVRRLALAVEKTDTTVLLSTDASMHRALPLPVALRLELASVGAEWLVRVAKERHGRVAAAAAPLPHIQLAG